MSKTNLLKNNILGLNKTYKTKGKMFNLFDAVSYVQKFSENGNNSKLNSCHTKSAPSSFVLKYNRDADINVAVNMDFNEYKTYSFWIYTEDKAAVGKELRLTFVSPASENFPLNFFNQYIKINNVGWNYYSGKICFAIDSVHEPRWDKIVAFNIHHNDNKCEDDITLYLDNFTLYDNEDSNYWGNHLAVLDNAAAFYVNGPRGIFNDKQYEIDKDNPSAKVFKEDDTYWLPLSVFAAYNDENATYNHDTKTLYMEFNNDKYVFVGGQNNVIINDSVVSLNFNICESNGALFIPHTYAMELFDLPHVYTNKFGLIILSKNEYSYDMVDDLDTLLDICYTCLFERPTKEQLISDIQNNIGSFDVHPRLYLNKNDFDRLREYLANDKKYQDYFNEMIALFGKDSEQYKTDPINHDKIWAALLLSRVASWSMFYKLTDDVDYAERAWNEIEKVCNFPDWKPGHFLTTAEVCVSASIAYDWLYDYLSPDRRKILETAIYEKALIPGLDHYEGRAGFFWPRTNWNGICNNGINSGAIAVLNAFPELCATILSYGILNIEKSLYTFAPDASHSESVMYWEYHVKYYHMYLAALECACGTDYGFLSSPGFLDSSYFPYYMQNELGSWPYHDSLGDIVINNYSYWFAVMKEDAFLAKLRDEQILRAQEIRINPPEKPTDDIGLSVCFYDLMWYKPFDMNNSKRNMSLDAHYRLIDTVSMRSGWEKGEIFTGLHGGNNAADHGDLDTGTFILYAKGHKFFDDFGKENYDAPGYFSWPGTVRYSYYRKRAEGHNTLTMGECDRYKYDQAFHTCSRFSRVESSDSTSFAILDMTDAFRNYSPVYVNRGLLFTDNRSTIIIQDELKLNEKYEIRWHAHTLKEFNTKITNNGLSAILDADDCKLYCEIVCGENKNDEDIGARFIILPADSLDKSYKNVELEWSRDKYEKLMIITKKHVNSLKMAVLFKIIKNDETVPELGSIYNYIPMDNWKI